MKKTQLHRKEERLNAISHGIGALFGLLGCYGLLAKNSGKTAFATFSILVYALTFVSMFLISAWYHHAKLPDHKRKLRIADHITIYFLIAGTYTPVCLITLLNDRGGSIFYTVWAIAAAGTFLKLRYTGRYEILSLVLYLAMGWLVIFDFNALKLAIAHEGLQLLFLGGVFYTVGILFYAVERIPYNHFIWHLFVLAGALSHWLLIYCYVI